MSLLPPESAEKVGADTLVWQLSPMEVLENWEELAELLQPCIDVSRGELSTFSLLHACAHAQSYAFVGTFQGIARAALIASLYQFLEYKICHIDAYAGKASLFYQYLPTIEIWAKANGCTFLEGGGSAAAERLAQKHGFSHSHMIYRKHL